MSDPQIPRKYGFPGLMVIIWGRPYRADEKNMSRVLLQRAVSRRSKTPGFDHIIPAAVQWGANAGPGNPALSNNPWTMMQQPVVLRPPARNIENPCGTSWLATGGG